MKIKEGVFDRIEQAFVLFKDNFKELFLPMFIYNFIFVVIIGAISTYLTIITLSDVINEKGVDYFNILNDTSVVIGIVMATIVFIVYLMFYIVIFLGLLESIRQIEKGEKISISKNIKYGFMNFNSSMKTYWYIFTYIMLVPVILFIIGGGIFNLSYLYPQNYPLMKIGGAIMIISLITFIIFSIYRGTKAMFALYSAVDKNKYSKINFLHSVKITNDNWWRILGNFLLLGILIFLVSGLISSILSLITFGLGGGGDLIETILGGLESKNPEFIKSALEEYISNFSLIYEVIGNTLDAIIKTISSIFGIIFTYLFYLRLNREFEYTISINSELENNQEIDL